jgi:hypothetical protein
MSASRPWRGRPKRLDEGGDGMGMVTHPVSTGGEQRAAQPVRQTRWVDRALAIAVLAMFVVVWVGFALALSGNSSILDSSWEWLRSLPGPIQVVVWILFLPIAVGLWIWESTWPPLVALLLVAGMIAWTFVAIAGAIRAFRPA